MVHYMSFWIRKHRVSIILVVVIVVIASLVATAAALVVVRIVITVTRLRYSCNKELVISEHASSIRYNSGQWFVEMHSRKPSCDILSERKIKNAI